MEAFQHELTTLVEELRPDTAEALFALLVDALDGLPRPDGVADHRRLEKPAALLDEYEAVDALAPRRGAEGGQAGEQQGGGAISALIRAGIRGTRDMIKEPVEAVASIRRRDALVNEKAELARNELNNRVSLLTPWVRKNGMSTVDRERLERTTGQVAEAFGMAVMPKMEDIYTDRFLPRQADRMVI